MTSDNPLAFAWHLHDSLLVGSMIFGSFWGVIYDLTSRRKNTGPAVKIEQLSSARPIPMMVNRLPLASLLLAIFIIVFIALALGFQNPFLVFGFGFLAGGLIFTMLLNVARLGLNSEPMK